MPVAENMLICIDRKQLKDVTKSFSVKYFFDTLLVLSIDFSNL